jgi:hypothetical protein
MSQSKVTEAFVSRRKLLLKKAAAFSGCTHTKSACQNPFIKIVQIIFLQELRAMWNAIIFDHTKHKNQYLVSVLPFLENIASLNGTEQKLGTVPH